MCRGIEESEMENKFNLELMLAFAIRAEENLMNYFSSRVNRRELNSSGK